MFMDYILESEMDCSNEVSQETMEEINNIPIPSLSECAGMSPFEMMSKANYEFALENTNMFKAVSLAEMSYIRKYGEEPIWESSDTQNIFQKFIESIKKIIGKITATFDKLITAIERKVQEIYNKKAEQLKKRISDSESSKWRNHTFKIKKYDSSIGKAILDKDPISTLNKVDSFKHIKDLLDKNQTESEFGKTDIAKGLIKDINEAILDGKVSGVDYNSTKSIKSALTTAMISEEVEANYTEALDQCRIFVRDPKAGSMKSELRKRYAEIKKNLGKCIDDVKKTAKKNDRSTRKGSLVGIYVNALNKYIQTAHCVYQVTSGCITRQWFQSVRIYLVLTSAIKKSDKEYDREQRKNSKPDADTGNPVAEFSFNTNGWE